MNADVITGMILATAGGPSPFHRDGLLEQARSFVAGRQDLLEVAWDPAVRRVNQRGEGELRNMDFIWLRLSRTPDADITISVRLETRGELTTDVDPLTRFGQVAIEVAGLARMLNEVL